MKLIISLLFSLLICYVKPEEVCSGPNSCDSENISKSHEKEKYVAKGIQFSTNSYIRISQKKC